MRKAVLIGSLAALVACTDRPRVTLHTAQGEVPVRVELATTPESRSLGLMYRKELDQGAGMLFVFPTAEEHQFWMKNTPLPLDMIFIGANDTIAGIVENTKPFSTAPRGVSEPSRCVLEVNAGFAVKHGLRIGDRVEFHYVPSAEK